MNGYLNTVIVTVTVCQIAQMITQNTESYRRFVHIMCALVLLLTIAKPIGWVMTNIDCIVESIRDWGTTEAADTAADDPMETTAQAVMEHAIQAFSLDPEGMKVTLITDEESGRLTEIQLYVFRCSYTERVYVSEKLTELYGIPVYLYNDRSE